MASSMASRPFVSRAVRITWAPALPSARAVAAPMPLLAPVTSATWPAKGFSAWLIYSGDLVDGEGKLGRTLPVSQVGQAGGIVTAEAGVAILRAGGVAASQAHGAIEPVNRDEREAVGLDKFGQIGRASCRERV